MYKFNLVATGPNLVVLFIVQLSNLIGGPLNTEALNILPTRLVGLIKAYQDYNLIVNLH